MPDGDHVVPLGEAAVVAPAMTSRSSGSRARSGCARRPPRRWPRTGSPPTVLDLRTLVPLDAAAVLASVRRTGRVVIVEENPGQLGWGAASPRSSPRRLRRPRRTRVASRAATCRCPSPRLEAAVMPSPERVVEAAVASSPARHNQREDDDPCGFGTRTYCSRCPRSPRSPGRTGSRAGCWVASTSPRTAATTCASPTRTPARSPPVSRRRRPARPLRRRPVLRVGGARLPARADLPLHPGEPGRHRTTARRATA